MIAKMRKKRVWHKAICIKCLLMLANLKFMILNLCILYVKTQDLQRKIAEKFFVFKASEHLYFKEQGQKDIKVQVCFVPLPF